MSKKIRRKKDSNEERYDLIQIDEKVKKIIIEDNKNIEEYKKKLDTIIDELSSCKAYKKRNELREEREKLIKKIDDIENNTIFAEYCYLSQTIVSDYKKINSSPIKASFFSCNNISDTDSKKREELFYKFLEIAKNYIPLNIFKDEVVTKHVCSCGNSIEFNYTENSITCENCGIEKNIYTISTNFKDVERVNLSQKYKYNKKTHFRDTINQYQGKQNKKIPPKIYTDCDGWFKKQNLLTSPKREGLTESEYFHSIHKKIKKIHIDMALSETTNTSYYEDINLIYSYFTGIPCPDISHIEKELDEDFDKAVEAYDKIEGVDRTNFLNGQYVLRQLLKRRKEQIEEDDFHKLTRDRLLEHDEIYSKICLINEWSMCYSS